jgi:hypothetical protein
MVLEAEFISQANGLCRLHHLACLATLRTIYISLHKCTVMLPEFLSENQYYTSIPLIESM